MQQDKAQTAGPEKAGENEGRARIVEDAPFPHQAQWFLALLLLIAGSRLALLFLSRHFLMADEALTGMMALDISQGRPIPLFPYGNTYAGGHTVEALMMVPWFKLFGARDWIVAGVPALMACLTMTVVYQTVYRFFSKRLALASLAVLACCCAFASYNFEVNGSMTTLFFAWSGLYFFFSHDRGERPRYFRLFLAGTCLGFAIYCFDYALFFVIAGGGFMIYRHRLGLWRQGRALGALAGGFILGLSPLIGYNLTHHFSNLKHLITPTDAQRNPLQPAFLKHARALVAHDLPAFFTTEINDFVLHIPWTSYLAWIVFCAALGYLVFQMRRPLRDGVRGLPRRRPPDLGPEGRILFFLYLFALYALLYCISPYSGSSPRYLLLFFPALPILFAWAMLRLGRTRPGVAALATALFLAPQLWQIAVMAGDKTTTEWNIRMNGEDIPKLVRYLEENRFNDVVTPYEIKWKLLFASQRRILGAAKMFGFDRENEVNRIVLDRINQKQAPLVMVFDKDLKFPRVTLNFNPQAAFDIDGFFSSLKENHVTFQTTAIGGYVVYHHFSQFLPFVPRDETP